MEILQKFIDWWKKGITDLMARKFTSESLALVLGAVVLILLLL